MRHLVVLQIVLVLLGTAGCSGTPKRSQPVWAAQSGGRDALRPPEGLTRAATVVLGSHLLGPVEASRLDPDRHEVIVVGGRVHPLAANFSPPIAVIRAPGGGVAPQRAQRDARKRLANRRIDIVLMFRLEMP